MDSNTMNAFTEVIRKSEIRVNAINAIDNLRSMRIVNFNLLSESEIEQISKAINILEEIKSRFNKDTTFYQIKHKYNI